MQLPLQITFHGVAHSDAIEAAVRKRAQKLEHFASDIMRCRVGIVMDENHQQHGKPFTVRVEVTMPDHDLVSNNAHDEDVYVALRDAFDATVRMIETVTQRRRDRVQRSSA